MGLSNLKTALYTVLMTAFLSYSLTYPFDWPTDLISSSKKFLSIPRPFGGLIGEVNRPKLLFVYHFFPVNETFVHL